MYKIFQIATVLGFAGSLACGGTALAYTGQKYATEAKIGMTRAEQIALKAQPGKVTDSELEHETGGSGLRYSFDIKSGTVTHEVGIDAKTGKVLENSVESANPN